MASVGSFSFPLLSVSTVYVCVCACIFVYFYASLGPSFACSYSPRAKAPFSILSRSFPCHGTLLTRVFIRVACSKASIRRRRKHLVIPLILVLFLVCEISFLALCPPFCTKNDFRPRAENSLLYLCTSMTTLNGWVVGSERPLRVNPQPSTLNPQPG